MSFPLLSTKLYLPPLRPGLVPRPRLTRRLAEGLQRPLTLISALNRLPDLGAAGGETLEILRTVQRAPADP